MLSLTAQLSALVLFLLVSVNHVAARLLTPRAARATNGTSDFDWSALAPSPDLTWTPCFGNFTCTRLQVPLNYSNPATGTAAIAFIKSAAKANPDTAQSIVFNFGGPGGSGVGEVIVGTDALRELVGDEYNIVSFDPRAVNNSEPFISCFGNDTESERRFSETWYSEAANASSTAISTQFVAAEIWSERCSNFLQQQPSGVYVSTPAVATDMLRYAQAEARLNGKSESDAKLWYYGFSYGTVLGATFAGMFPDNIGRMINDGVVDSEDYYTYLGKTSLEDTDKVVENFATYCNEAGSANCSFWGPSTEDILSRIDTIFATLKENPIAVSGLNPGTETELMTYTRLKLTMFLAIYFPIPYFPLLADILYGVEQRNVSIFGPPEASLNPYAITEAFDSSQGMIICVDGHGGPNLSTIQDYTQYVEKLESQSHYLGDMAPTVFNERICSGLQLDVLPGSSYQGPLPPSANHTSFPILFTTSLLDPVTPIFGAYKMSNAFPGSSVLVQNSSGHTASFSGSVCLGDHVKAYFKGQVPPTNTTCSPTPLLSPLL